MSQPPSYDRQFNFQNQQLQTPADPVPADELDSEFNSIKLTLDATLANIALIQRDDGQLANETVGEDQLKPELVLLGNSLAEILVAAAEVEADRLAAEAAKNAAQVAQSAAELAETNAETAETNAETAETNAETAQTAAELAETHAETAETNAELAEANAEAAQALAEAAQAAAEVAQAAAETASTRMTGTSISTVAIGLGAKSFTTQGDRFFSAGTWLTITSDANPSVNYMAGVVTAYTAGALDVSVTKAGGSGTFSDWTLRVSGTVGADGVGVGDVLAAAAFADDERLIRSDGVVKGVQASTAALTDAGALSGLTTISTSGSITVGTTAATAPIVDPSGFAQLPEVAAPATPASGFVRLYAKSDNKLYSKDDGGIETALGGGGLTANGKLVWSVGSSALTIALKTLAGNDPSASDPVYVRVRDTTLTTDASDWVTVTSALSLVISNGSLLGAATPATTTGNTTNTSTTISAIPAAAIGRFYVGQAISGTGIPAGATVATIASATSITISAAATATNTGVTLTLGSQAFRLWAVLFNDGGTPRIGLINCRSGNNIFPLSGWEIASSTAEGGAGAADSAHVFYTGAAVAAKPYAVLGNASWETGLGTAGVWSVAPTRVGLWLGGKLPGDTVQIADTVDVTTRTTTSTSFTTTTITATLVPSSAANMMYASINAAGDCDAIGNTIGLGINRGTYVALSTFLGRDNIIAAIKSGSSAGLLTLGMTVPDFPQINTSLTYTLMFATTSGTATLGARNGGSVTAPTYFGIKEIMS